MEKEYKTINASLTLPYQIACGKTWTKIFCGLKEEIIWGTRCAECNRLLVPARSFCPRCFIDTDDWVACSQEGTLVAWVLTNFTYFSQPLKPPYITGLIRLDGTDVNFIHLIGGFPFDDLEGARKYVKDGMRVRAVWNEVKAGHILDIKYFCPV